MVRVRDSLKKKSIPANQLHLFGITPAFLYFSLHQSSFTLDGYITGGTGAFSTAKGVVSYSGHGLNDMSQFYAFVSIISNAGN